LLNNNGLGGVAVHHLGRDDVLGGHFTVLSVRERVRVGCGGGFDSSAHRVPVDLEFGHSGLIGGNGSHQLVVLWLGWRVILELRVVVLVVDVVADTSELLASVRSGYENNRDTDGIISRNFSNIRWVCLDKTKK
jgi:hypothetical protein